MTNSIWKLAMMRHAKSDWADAGLSDHDRPLNSRGRNDAPEMARWLEAQDAVPELILASTAKRVKETVELLQKSWKRTALILRSESLYLASPETILEHIRSEGIDSEGRRPQRLLVIGHNPGMSQLVSSLSGAHTDLPTAAVALFECESIRVDDERAPRIRRLLAIGRPKELH